MSPEISPKRSAEVSRDLVKGSPAKSAETVALLRRAGIKRLYLNAKDLPINEPDQMAAFNRLLHENGIEVHLLYGPATWIKTESGRTNIINYLDDRVADFNLAHAPEDQMASVDNDEAVGYLADRLNRLGVEDKLVELGAVEGDDVLIGHPDDSVVFEFKPSMDAGAEILARRGEDQRFNESRPAAARRRAIQEAMATRVDGETRADVARRLDQAARAAGSRYVVFLADMYGKAVRPSNADEARAAATSVRADRALMRRRAQAAVEVLKAQGDEVALDTRKLGAIGFCFGGGAVLELARSGAPLQGFVSFHGNLDTPNPAHWLKRVLKTLECRHRACHRLSCRADDDSYGHGREDILQKMPADELDCGARY